ncbi:uncharacterized protein LOC143023974 [Oratosquilla oratoria]|uniref:uncharacterized protein LOC143023974 n=1 Tax=Oratosquilla oratoria TaxID=337810 RepID=UPI003F76926F
MSSHDEENTPWDLTDSDDESNVSVTKFKCDKCSYETNHGPNLKRHRANRHPDGTDHPSYACEHCGYRSSYRSSIKRHLSRRSENGECPRAKKQKVEEEEYEAPEDSVSDADTDEIETMSGHWVTFHAQMQALKTVDMNNAMERSLQEQEHILTLKEVRERTEREVAAARERGALLEKDIRTFWTESKRYMKHLEKTDCRQWMYHKHIDGGDGDDDNRTPCPIYGCIARPLNLLRHLSGTHKLRKPKQMVNRIKAMEEEIKLQQAAITTNSPAGGSGKPKPRKKNKYKLVRCPMCDKVVKRIDCHLFQKHHLSKQSDNYKKFMQQAVPVVSPLERNEEQDDIRFVLVDEQSGKEIRISVQDSVRDFMRGFTDFLSTFKGLQAATISKHVSILQKLIGHEAQGCAVEVSRELLEAIIRKLPLSSGYIMTNNKNWTAGYKRNIVTTCRLVMNFITRQPQESAIVLPQNVAQDLDNILDTLRMRYVKIEKGERALKRDNFMKGMLHPFQIKKVLQGNYVQEVMKQCKIDYESGGPRTCPSKHWAVRVRNVLITLLSITNIRRSVEFTEFRVQELRDSVYKKGTWYTGVKRHKTAMSLGPAKLFTTQDEHTALQCFLRYYRPALATCDGDQCYLFCAAKIKKVPANQCCVKMDVSAVNKSLSTVGSHCGLTCRLGTRAIRKTVISTAYEQNSDPGVRATFADQAAHDPKTSAAYYDLSAKHIQGSAVREEVVRMIIDTEDPEEEAEDDSDTTLIDDTPTVPSGSEVSESILPAVSHSREEVEEAASKEEEAVVMVVASEENSRSEDVASHSEEASIIGRSGEEKEETETIISFAHSEATSMYTILGLGDKSSDSSEFSFFNSGSENGNVGRRKFPQNFFKDVKNAKKAVAVRDDESTPGLVSWGRVREWLLRQSEEYCNLSVEEIKRLYKTK